jgi:hypothetical protein
MVIRAVSFRRDRLDRIRLMPQNEAGWANTRPASTFNRERRDRRQRRELALPIRPIHLEASPLSMARWGQLPLPAITALPTFSRLHVSQLAEQRMCAGSVAGF